MDQACVLCYIAGESLLRHIDVMSFSFRIEECLVVFLLHLQSFAMLYSGLYASKSYQTQYPKHNPNLLLPVLRLVFWHVFSVLRQSYNVKDLACAAIFIFWINAICKHEGVVTSCWPQVS